jgi:crotonobetainyl-CoA:carnitine CoA-transferase CaiB-like acyl-CoA transferase
MSGALRGVRVIDFGQYIAGPLAAMLLADAGAEVIHVDPPGGPRWKTPANQTWNRGKQVAVLDLHSAAGVASARQLIASADVVVENFRAGVMDRLGVGAAPSMHANPRLIYCSLPGFAADDPRAGVKAWEGVIGAATDTYRMAANGGQPVFTPVPIASHFGAIVAGVSIVMALIARERDGQGQRVEVPLFDAMFAAIGAHGLFVDGEPAGGRPDDYWTGVFQCADQRWVQLSAATPRFRRQLASALGLSDWEAEGLFDVDRLAHSAALQAELQARQPRLFASRSAQEWENLGGRIGVPIIMCRSTAEWTETPHARAAGMVRDEAGTRQAGPPVRLLSDTTGVTVSPLDVTVSPPGVTVSPSGVTLPATPPPYTQGWRRGVVGPRPGNEADNGLAALAGVRVLDLTQVLAGPTAGRTLAEFGADVVKVNNPNEQGAGIHFSRHRYHTDVNRGKRSLLLDLKQPEGRAILSDLIQRSDVILQNFRPDATERLGLTYAAVRKQRPDIVYVSISAFGGPGLWSGWPGYEVQAQAATGLRFAGLARPTGQPFAVNDYGTGLCGAFAAALGLFARARTGHGQHAEAALAYTATLLQSAGLNATHAGLQQSTGFDDTEAPLLEQSTWLHTSDEALAEAAALNHTDDRGLGWSSLQRLYRASDGWFFLGATRHQVTQLTPDISEPALEKLFGSATVNVWVERLTRLGIGAHGLVPIAELMHDAWVTAHGLSITRIHDTGECVTSVGPVARLSRTPVQPGRPTVTPGADAADVLRDVNRETQLDGLLDQGVVGMETPRLASTSSAARSPANNAP